MIAANEGFVDPHTHLVFAGERSTEFDLPYHLGVNHARIVMRNGQVVARNTALHTALCA